jgi:hypothetical protein
VDKRKIYLSFFISLLVSMMYTSGSGQQLKVGVNRNKIFIGEQIKLKLAVEGGRAGLKWFSLPDSLNHFEIVKRDKIDTVLNGRFTNYYQLITITSFDSGRWQFPSLFLPGIVQPTPPVTIDVLPVDVSKMQDYNDIKNIQEVEQQNNWTIVAIIAAITLLSIGMIWWLIVKKKKAKVERKLPQPTLTPLEWALAELNKLKAQRPETPADLKKYYSGLTDISRAFVYKQLHINSMQQTTDEWMVSLQPLEVDNESKTSFFQVLRLADTVKFARFLPHPRDNETSVEIVRNMLQKISLLHSPVHSNYQPKHT